MKTLLPVAVLWIACGYVTWGHRFPYSDNREVAAGFAAIGPLGLVSAIVCGGPPYHWRTKPMTVEERWHAFERQWPSLNREYFEQSEN